MKVLFDDVNSEYYNFLELSSHTNHDIIFISWLNTLNS